MAGNGGPQTVLGALQRLQRVVDASMLRGRLRNMQGMADIANTSVAFARLVSSRMLRPRPANETLVEPAPRLRLVRSLIAALQCTVPERAQWFGFYDTAAMAMLAVCSLSMDPHMDGIKMRPWRCAVTGLGWYRQVSTLPELESLGRELLGAITHAYGVVKRNTALWKLQARRNFGLRHGSAYEIWSAQLNLAFVVMTLQEWLQGTPAWAAADSPDAERERLLFVVDAFTDGMHNGLESFLDMESVDHQEFARMHLIRAICMPAQLHIAARDRQPAVLHALLDGCARLLEQAAEICQMIEDDCSIPGSGGEPPTHCDSFVSVMDGLAQAIRLAAAVRPPPQQASLERCLDACSPFLEQAFMIGASEGSERELLEAFRTAERCLEDAIAQAGEAAQPRHPPPPPPLPVDPEEARAKAAKKAAKKERQRAKKAAASQGPAAEDALQPEQGAFSASETLDAAARDPSGRAQPAEAQPAAHEPAEQRAAAAQPADAMRTAQPAAERPGATQPAVAEQAAELHLVEGRTAEGGSEAPAVPRQPAELQLAEALPAQEGAGEAQAAAEPAAEDLRLGQRLAQLQVAGQPATEEQQAQAQLLEQPASAEEAAEAQPAAAHVAVDRPSSSGQIAPAAAREPRSRSSSGAASTSAAGQGGDGSLDLPPGLTARRQQPAAAQRASSGQQHERAAGLRNGRTGPAAASSGSRVPAALQQQGPGARAVAARPRPRPPAREQQASHADGSSAALQPDGTAVSGSGPADAWLEELCTCPITQELFTDPVIATDGITYERAAIEEWVRRRGTSPMTQAALGLDGLQPNLIVRQLVRERLRGA